MPNGQPTIPGEDEPAFVALGPKAMARPCPVLLPCIKGPLGLLFPLRLRCKWCTNSIPFQA